MSIFVFVAAKIDKRSSQRFRAHEHALDRCEHFFGRAAIRRFVHVDQNIGAMK